MGISLPHGGGFGPFVAGSDPAPIPDQPAFLEIDGGDHMLVMNEERTDIFATGSDERAVMMIRAFQSETKAFLLSLDTVQKLHGFCEEIMARAAADALKDGGSRG